MPSFATIRTSIAVLACLAMPCVAAAEGNPFEPSPRPAEGVRWQAGIDRDIAIYVAKHLQRTCRGLSAYPCLDPDNPRASEMQARALFAEVDAGSA